MQLQDKTRIVEVELIWTQWIRIHGSSTLGHVSKETPDIVHSRRDAELRGSPALLSAVTINEL